jgi:hypothetical protein
MSVFQSFYSVKCLVSSLRHCATKTTYGMFLGHRWHDKQGRWFRSALNVSNITRLFDYDTTVFGGVPNFPPVVDIGIPTDVLDMYRSRNCRLWWLCHLVVIMDDDVCRVPRIPIKIFWGYWLNWLLSFGLDSINDLIIKSFDKIVWLSFIVFSTTQCENVYKTFTHNQTQWQTRLKSLTQLLGQPPPPNPFS